jgi:hypothetical protein
VVVGVVGLASPLCVLAACLPITGPLVGDWGVKLDASKIADMEIRATARAIWSADARTEPLLFRFIFYSEAGPFTIFSRKFGTKFPKILWERLIF